MSESKPSATPGPWEIEPSTAKGAWIGNIHGWAALALGKDDENAKANARLIAAAPDMIEALRDVESKIVDYEAGRINWRPDDFLMRVRAAIAKTTNGQ